MSAKKQSPPRKELVDLYEVQALSTRKIAAIYKVSKGLVSRWLCLYNMPLNIYNLNATHRQGNIVNPEGINTGNCLQATTCPVSLGRLKELHDIQLYSMNEISAYLSKQFNRRLALHTIQQWFKLSGIVTRPRNVACRIAAKKQYWKYSIVKATEAANASLLQKEAASIFAKKTNIKARRSYIKNCKAKRVQRTCQWTTCRAEFDVKPSKIKYGYGRFCSKSCAMKFRRRNEKLAKLTALTQPTTTLTREQALAKLGITDIPKHL